MSRTPPLRVAIAVASATWPVHVSASPTSAWNIRSPVLSECHAQNWLNTSPATIGTVLRSATRPIGRSPPSERMSGT